MSVINYEEALDRFDGEKDIYLELAQTFLSTGPEDFESYKKAAAESNGKKVLYHSHKLKGAALIVGAESLAETASKIETAARCGETDYDRRFTRELEERYHLAMQDMEELVKELQKSS